MLRDSINTERRLNKTAEIYKLCFVCTILGFSPAAHLPLGIKTRKKIQDSTKMCLGVALLLSCQSKITIRYRHLICICKFWCDPWGHHFDECHHASMQSTVCVRIILSRISKIAVCVVHNFTFCLSTASLFCTSRATLLGAKITLRTLFSRFLCAFAVVAQWLSTVGIKSLQTAIPRKRRVYLQFEHTAWYLFKFLACTYVDIVVYSSTGHSHKLLGEPSVTLDPLVHKLLSNTAQVM